MTYNHKNERTIRGYAANGSVWKANAVQFVYDENSHLIGEYSVDGVPLVEYVWLGDKPADGTTTVWAWDSTAFGVSLPSVQTVKFNLRLPGQYYDEVTKQHYNHNRFYNPVLGRYVEPDRIGLEGGLNPYIYTGGNPVSNVDSTGLCTNDPYCSGSWGQPLMNFSADQSALAIQRQFNFGSGTYIVDPMAWGLDRVIDIGTQLNNSALGANHLLMF
ncbi:RHS repeat-associated core domain-containing protein [Acinetobacter sp. RW6]|uniref:RHS repeat-associated core domain-containing protein n=1 Tax=Acinetobacter sp. RW6 TaxID=3242680 RepID=UPI0035C0AD42